MSQRRMLTRIHDRAQDRTPAKYNPLAPVYVPKDLPYTPSAPEYVPDDVQVLTYARKRREEKVQQESSVDARFAPEIVTPAMPVLGRIGAIDSNAAKAARLAYDRKEYDIVFRKAIDDYRRAGATCVTNTAINNVVSITLHYLGCELNVTYNPATFRFKINNFVERLFTRSGLIWAIFEAIRVMTEYCSNPCFQTFAQRALEKGRDCAKCCTFEQIQQLIHAYDMVGPLVVYARDHARGAPPIDCEISLKFDDAQTLRVTARCGERTSVTGTADEVLAYVVKMSL